MYDTGMNATNVTRLSIADIRSLDEGAIIGFRVRDAIVKARVLSAVTITVERGKGGRFGRTLFYVPVEYRDPRTGQMRAHHVTQGLRDLLVRPD